MDLCPVLTVVTSFDYSFHGLCIGAAFGSVAAVLIPYPQSRYDNYEPTKSWNATYRILRPRVIFGAFLFAGFIAGMSTGFVVTFACT
jgi:hypothetical protein